MIENVMLLLRGTLSGRNVNELMQQCHPLGMFKDSTMRNIPSFEATPRGNIERSISYFTYHRPPFTLWRASDKARIVTMFYYAFHYVLLWVLTMCYRGFSGYAELYETVLVDTPVGPYFQQYLDESQKMFGTASDMRNILEVCVSCYVIVYV